MSDAEQTPPQTAELPPLVIKEELWLWLILEHGNATEGMIARMLGMDVVEMRNRYSLYVAANGSARENRMKQIVARLLKQAPEQPPPKKRRKP